MTKISSILMYVIGIYLLLVLIMFTFQRSLLYLPSKEKLDPFFYSSMGLKKIQFKTSDGLILSALFKKPTSKSAKTLVVFHGNAGHIGHRVEKFRPFLDEGIGLLLVEYGVMVKIQANQLIWFL